MTVSAWKTALLILLVAMALASVVVGVGGLLDSLGVYGQGSSKFACFLFGWTSGSAFVAFFQILALFRRPQSGQMPPGG